MQTGRHTSEQSQPSRTIAAINARITAGLANVATVQELAGMGETERQGIDVVTLGFSAPFAGTAAMLCVPVAGRGIFTRAEKISLNGIPGLAGPAPNERLGVVDTLIVVDRRDRGLPPHAAAELLAGLINGERVKVECLSVEGTFHEREATLEEIEFARLYVYSSEVPSAQGRRPPFLELLRRGARILVNGSDGLVIGTGSRDRTGVPAISLAADMHDMRPELMVWTRTAPRHVVAVAIPILSASIPSALLAWRSEARPLEALGGPADEAAAVLRARIKNGQFLLTDSDRPL